MWVAMCYGYRNKAGVVTVTQAYGQHIAQSI